MKKHNFLAGLAVGLAVVIIVELVIFGASGTWRLLTNGTFADEPIMVNEDPREYSNDEYGEFEEKVDDVLDHLDKYYYEDLETEDMYEEAVRGMVQSIGDPYTSYFTTEEFDSFQEKMQGSYEGIGVVVSYGETENEIIVVSPFKDSPGEKAGMKPSDIISAVDGVDVGGMTLDKVIERIKGEKDTEVIITVRREGELIDLTVIRDVIVIPTIEYELLEDNVGYIGMSGFDEVTEGQFVEALEALEKEGQDGLIIDLRNNPGGYLHIVYAIVDELLGKGDLVVYTEDKNGNREELVTKTKDSFDKPLVILINGNSASASEILAGAVKDHGIGTIVGETSFGKGLVQRTFDLDDGSAVKITVSRYYTPDGNYIHGVGIEPDVLVEYDPDSETDNQLDEAIKVLLEEIDKAE